ncbi:hypothetical protein P8452_77183 [Trifolium repens]|jgi:hypothetical protein|nr:hypothetical protein P8452_77183 [Trifolium repens]
MLLPQIHGFLLEIPDLCSESMVLLAKRFNSTRVSSSASGYDHLQQNGLGLGFSSRLVNLNHDDDYRNGFSTSNINNYSSMI